MQLSRRGSSLQRTSIPEESPSQGPLAFRKALKNPSFPGGQAQATKPLRGLGKLLATLAKAVIIITPATIILEGVFGWSRCGKASVTHCPTMIHEPNCPRTRAYSEVRRRLSHSLGPPCWIIPSMPKKHPLTNRSYLSAARSSNGFPGLPGLEAEPDSTQGQAFEMGQFSSDSPGYQIRCSLDIYRPP